MNNFFNFLQLYYELFLDAQILPQYYTDLNVESNEKSAEAILIEAQKNAKITNFYAYAKYYFNQIIQKA